MTFRDRERNRDGGYGWLKALVIIVIILLAFGGIFVLLGFDSVPVNHVGLQRDNISNRVGTKIYGNDLYWIGVTSDFILFPTTQQEVKLVESSSTDAYSPLDSRTKDGLLIYVQIVFYYRLQRDFVYELYMEFAKDWERVYVGQARTTLRDVISTYNAIQFFNNRTSIGEDMKIQLHTALSAEGFYAGIVTFQMREIDLPDEFETALESVQIAQQEYQIAIFEQEAALVRAETEIYLAQAQANITVLEAEANAESFLINVNAQAEGLNVTLTQTGLSYYALSQALNLTSTELLAYLWIQAIMEHDSSLLIIGENTPTLILNATNT